MTDDLTPQQLRELDAQIEREIIGKCPHPEAQIKKAINDRGSVVWRCECGEDIAYVDYLSYKPGQYGYACPLYTQDWRVIFEQLIPAMEAKGFHLSLSHLRGILEEGFCWEARFRKPGTSYAYSENGRIAICRAALNAVRDEKGEKA